ncbi:MAG: hypothetical protein NZ889_03005 [Candidatus Pacearchaeota archaeon]|nr:hypothetical protein [Candidatus Pacearchaeota archaeon]
MAEGKMRKKFENFDFETMKFDELEKVGATIEAKIFKDEEGICDECGVSSVVTKIKGRVLCNLCMNIFKKRNTR